MNVFHCWRDTTPSNQFLSKMLGWEGFSLRRSLSRSLFLEPFHSVKLASTPQRCGKIVECKSNTVSTTYNSGYKFACDRHGFENLEPTAPARLNHLGQPLGSTTWVCRSVSSRLHSCWQHLQHNRPRHVGHESRFGGRCAQKVKKCPPTLPSVAFAETLERCCFHALVRKQEGATNGFIASLKALLPKAQSAFIRIWKGWEWTETSAVTMVFEGSRQEADLQRSEVRGVLLKSCAALPIY